MGPCRDCGQWHCVCDWNRELLEEIRKLRAHRDETLLLHRSLKAHMDEGFQRFMAKVLHG